MTAAPPEQVLVVPRERLALDWATPGFLPADLEPILAAVREHGRFAPRPAVENDPDLKQIIPYCVVCRGEQVFLLERLGTQDESRLRHLFSLGVGGHINPDGGDRTGLVERSLRREIAEEIVIGEPYRVRPRGLVNDEGNDVGRVHLGLVYEVTPAADSPLAVAEKELMRGRLVPRAALAGYRDRMETWSRFIADGWLLL